MRGCLSVLSGIFALLLFMSVVYAGCSRFLKSNDAYERGVATAIEDPVVEETLGAPVEESWFYNGSIEGDGMTTRGQWSVRLRGAADAGTLTITGLKTAGAWRVVAMALKADGAFYVYAPGRGFVKTQGPGRDGGPPDILSMDDPTDLPPGTTTSGTTSSTIVIDSTTGTLPPAALEQLRQLPPEARAMLPPEIQEQLDAAE